MSDPIDLLTQRLGALDTAAVETHPGVLDEVHRSLVAELDHLAESVAGESRTGSADRHR